MRLCLILADRLDSAVATVCFRFEEAGYRIALLLPHDADLVQARQQMHGVNLLLDIEACEMDDVAALRQAMADIHARYGVPDVMIVHRPCGAEWLRDLQALCSARLIRVVEHAENSSAMEVLQDGSSANFNTIVAAHAGPLAPAVISEEERIASIRQRGGRAYEVAMLALYLASAEAEPIRGATMTVHSGRYLS